MGKLPPDFAAGDVELSFAVTHKLSVDIDRVSYVDIMHNLKVHTSFTNFIVTALHTISVKLSCSSSNIYKYYDIIAAALTWLARLH